MNIRQRNREVQASVKTNKIIGILGGMGPLATADLFRKIVLLTEASCDNDHIRIIIDNNVHIPDRTDAILHGGRDPLPFLLESVRLLERAGSEVIIMPCNTAHYYIGQLQRQTKIPFINMLRETSLELKAAGVVSIGLLATDGTCKSGIYEKELAKQGIDTVLPCAEDQQLIMEIIYRIKGENSNASAEGLAQAVKNLKSRRAEAIVLGCTELPIAFQDIEAALPLFDPAAILAKRAIRFVGKNVRTVQ